MSELTRLDRAIAYLSPSRGAARAQARAVLEVLAYEGARKSRREEGWITAGTSANDEIAAGGATLRERARSLVRDNPHAKKALSVLVSNTVGTGILTQAAGPNRKVNAKLDDRLERWFENCDLAGAMDMYGLQGLVERTRRESGEVLIRFVPISATGYRDIGLRLQVLEPDYIDSTKVGDRIRNGIEYNARGEPVRYWLYPEHPGESMPIGARRLFTSSPVPAAQIIHFYKPLRAGQLRGVTDFAAVIRRLRDVDDYDDAETMRKKIAACVVGTVTTPMGLPGASLAPVTTDSSGRKQEGFRPAMFHYFRPGESVSFNDPKPSGDYADFMKVQLRAVASGLEMPYELLTGDLAEVNYTSHRGGLVQFRAMIEADQWQLLVHRVCLPIWRKFLEFASDADASIDPETAAIFTPPRFGLLDPAKEIPATIESIQGGLESYPNALRVLGYDWREKLEEIAEANAEMDRLNIVLTSDGRRAAKPAAAPVTEPEPAPTPDGAENKKEAA